MSKVFMDVLCVGLGGFIGSALRYMISVFSLRLFPGPYPVGTWIVNVLGCFLIGCAGGWIMAKGIMPDGLRLFFIVGCLGGFTTFSTFGFETYQLHVNEHFGLALMNIVLQVVMGLVAVALGVYLTRSLS